MPVERIHVTLFFIGAIERSRIADLAALARGIAADAFELDLSVLGYWRHNRIVWAGTTHAPAPLGAVVAQLQERLAREGVPTDDRPYHPHVTLVRDAPRAPVSTALSVPRWCVNDFALVESVPGAGSVRYEVLERWPLARAPL